MSDSIESQGRTVDEAISEALLRLGARRDEVQVEVLEEPRSGLFGFLGGRSAKVMVTRKSGGRPRSRGSRGRGRRSAAKTKKDQQHKITTQEKSDQQKRSGRRPSSTQQRKPAAQSKSKDDRPREKTGEGAKSASSRRRQPRRGKPAASAEKPQEQSRTAEQARGKVQSCDAGAGVEKRRPAAAATTQGRKPTDSAPRAAAVPEQTVSPDDVGRVIAADIKAADFAAKIGPVGAADVPELLHQITTEVMRLGDFVCRCQVEPGDYHLVKVVTDDRSAGMLIGRHGASIDALEHVVERIATQAQGERVRMNLDINNYRRKREATLIELTEQALAEVRQTKKEVHTDPLCARERRIVHLAVKQAPGMKSTTVMSNDGKYVVLALDDGTAPEADAMPAIAAETKGDQEQAPPQDNGTDAERQTDL